MSKPGQRSTKSTQASSFLKVGLVKVCQPPCLHWSLLVGLLGTTVMVCWQDAWFPPASVAVWVMVVVPNGYGASSAFPSLRVPETVGPEQLSVAVGVPGSTLAAGSSGMLPFVVMLGGQVIIGGVLSTTVTVPVHRPEAPKLSVAVKVTLVAPSE